MRNVMTSAVLTIGYILLTCTAVWLVLRFAP